MNVLSIKRWRFTDVYPLPKQQNTNKTEPFHKQQNNKQRSNKTPTKQSLFTNESLLNLTQVEAIAKQRDETQ